MILKQKFKTGLIWMTLACLAWIAAGFVSAPSASAYPRGSLEQVENITGLRLEFGDSQNTLLLHLDRSDAQQQTAVFNLESLGTRKRKSNNYATRRHSSGLTIIGASYQGQTGSNLAIGVRLVDGIQGENSICQETASIQIDAGVEQDYPVVEGYSPKWKNYDFNGKPLTASVSLPVLVDDGQGTSQGCFELREDLSFTPRDNLPLFALSGAIDLQNDSCSGLTILGPGGDDLQVHSQTWTCYEDIDIRSVNNKNAFDCTVSSGRTRNRSYCTTKLREVDSPPFEQFYIFVENRNSQCGSRLLVERPKSDTASENLSAQWQDWHNKCNEGQYDKDADLKRVSEVYVKAYSVDQVGAAGLPASAGSLSSMQSDASGNPIPPSCELKWSGFGFGWIVCQVLRAASEVIYFTEDLVYSAMRIDRQDYNQEFDDNGQTLTYRGAWRNVKNLVSYALVAATLLMVISTALDIGVFQNYTVKKYLPRLIIGTILIQFSWALGDLLIQLFNYSGDLLAAIVFSAFPGAENWGLDDIFGGGNLTTAGTGTALGGGLYAFLSVYGSSGAILLVLPIILTAVLGFVVGFLAIVVRKFLIIALLVFAPLALAFWVLPGLDKGWRFCFKFFMYLLLIYPLILLTVSVGKVFSYLILL